MQTEESDSVFESREELEIGRQLPPPFARMYISRFLRRTEDGGWLYSVVIVPAAGEFQEDKGVKKP